MEKVKEVAEATEVKESTEVKSTELSQDQALALLIQGIKVATKRGAFELEETEGLLKAIKVFIK